VCRFSVDGDGIAVVVVVVIVGAIDFNDGVDIADHVRRFGGIGIRRTPAVAVQV